ncbi:hypothetical protein [Campylobacter sp.]|uniref:hypothetical protein n=1 Tax=Campylobacter sp. TaxID=205 RepID=UPI002A8344A5|nr:hypothetical protein [Campylobacter sp.]MDY4446572.1 hypothetical protein [Campylobacter sp.]
MDLSFLFDRQTGELISLVIGFCLGFMVCHWLNSKSFKKERMLLTQNKELEIKAKAAELEAKLQSKNLELQNKAAELEATKKDFELKIATIKSKIMLYSITEKYFFCDLIEQGKKAQIKAQYKNNSLCFNSCPFVNNGICDKTSKPCHIVLKSPV